jgi:DNA-binding CsgD family transcriptional regulator
VCRIPSRIKASDYLPSSQGTLTGWGMPDGTDDLGHSERHQSGDDPPGPQEPQPRLLARLIEPEFAYDRERAKLTQSSGNPASKALLLAKLRSQHQERRQPYIQKLAERHGYTHPQARSRPITVSVHTLSAPEVSILRSVMTGMHNNQIATALGLTETAVRDHIKSTLNKLVSATPHRPTAHRAGDTQRPDCS